MAGVVKKGLLDVKTKGKLGSTYKRRYVLLRRNTDEGTKGVEIMDHEGDTEDMEYLPLTGVWTVQDKASQNKKRYAFELVIGPHIVMTFSCPSLTEREEWTESFHILNRVSPYSPPLNAPDMYPVSLERNISAVEISVSGPCLLRIQDKAIVLYSECGRNKLHHWAAENIKNLTLERDQLKLEAYRPGSDTLMDFCFNTEIDIGRLILTSWNMVLMRSVDPEKLNLISSYILNQNETLKDGGGGSGNKSVSLSKNFFGSLKQKGTNGVVTTVVTDEKGVRRAKSFSEKMQNEIRVSPDPHKASSRLSIASQESYTINAVPQQQGSDEEYRLSPPPIPPRAPRRPQSLGVDMIDATVLRPDPDYSTIPDRTDDNPMKSLEVKRIPSSCQNTSTGSAASLDKELDDLLKDIEEDNQRKRRLTLDSTTTHRISPIVPYEVTIRSRTIGSGGGSMRYSENFVRQKKEFYSTHGPSHEASDYLEPVPSQRAATQEDPKRSSNPPQLTTYLLQKKDSSAEDLLLQQIKRHSTSGDFSSLRIKDASSHHDYSIIPDKITISTQQPIITPQHFHTASTDSTQSAPELPPPRFSRRSQGPLEHDPPSPNGGVPPHSPTKMLRFTTTNNNAVEDIISPYATSKGLNVEKSPLPKSDPSPPPPLPPRSPVRHIRERVSMPSVTGQRCTQCNGMKQKQLLGKTQSLADHHSRHHHAHHHHHTHNHHAHSASNNDIGSLPDLLGKVNFTTDSYLSQTSQSSESSSQSISSKGHPSSSSRNPSLSSEEAMPSIERDQSLESALQKLDECMKGLEILGDPHQPAITPNNSVPKRSHSTKDRHAASTIDQALSNTQQIQSDLLMAKKEHRKSYEQLHRSSTIIGNMTTHHNNSSNNKRSPPSNGRHLMTGHRSSPAISEIDTMTPPAVPPRSLVSLHSLPSPHTHLDRSSVVTATAPHTPIHRYLSQNTPDKSNTVFIQHMRIGAAATANAHSSIV